MKQPSVVRPLTLQRQKKGVAVQTLLDKYGEFIGDTPEEFIEHLISKMTHMSDQLMGFASWAENASFDLETEIEDIRDAVKKVSAA